MRSGALADALDMMAEAPGKCACLWFKGLGV